MNWFSKRTKLDAESEARWLAWQAMPATDLKTPLQQLRCVSVDVETSGLDLRQDRLLAIGAIALDGASLDLKAALHIILRQEKISNVENILLHGIGGQAQQTGMDPVQALLDFLDFIGQAPLVGFHAGFDAQMITRAAQQYLGVKPKWLWLDLAIILPALFPQFKYSTLDAWLTHFGITNIERHHALSDAYVTAQLCQIVFGEMKHANLAALLRLEKNAHWLGRGNLSVFA